MVAEETSSENAFETTLTAEYGPTDLTAAVVTKGSLITPSILVIEPDDDAQREIIRFNGTFGASSFVTQNVSFRYLPGSAAGSGLTHPSGSIVRSVPTVQHLEDINDRVDALDHGADLKLALAGGTLTGFLTLHADPDAALKAATKQYVDAAKPVTDDDLVATFESTTAATYGNNLATTGSAVTLVTGTKVLVTVSASLANDTAGLQSLMGYEITGATSLGAGDAIALAYESSNAGDIMQASWSTFRTVTAGTNTFHAKYRTGPGGGTSTFGNRNISVVAYA